MRLDLKLKFLITYHEWIHLKTPLLKQNWKYMLDDCTYVISTKKNEKQLKELSKSDPYDTQ